MERAALIYGQPSSGWAQFRSLLMQPFDPAWRGEPEWLIYVREVAQQAISDYYGDHE